jgi:hypothetical protein
MLNLLILELINFYVNLMIYNNLSNMPVLLLES